MPPAAFRAASQTDMRSMLPILQGLVASDCKRASVRDQQKSNAANRRKLGLAIGHAKALYICHVLLMAFALDIYCGTGGEIL